MINNNIGVRFSLIISQKKGCRGMYIFQRGGFAERIRINIQLALHLLM